MGSLFSSREKIAEHAVDYPFKVVEQVIDGSPTLSECCTEAVIDVAVEIATDADGVSQTTRVRSSTV